MGWGLGHDERWNRDIGYGVPAYCDHAGCDAEIDRGLSYVCAGEPYGGEYGCGLYFCGKHLFYTESKPRQTCERCMEDAEPFEPKPEHPDWINHKLTDESWADWRAANPDEVAALRSCSTPTRSDSGQREGEQ